jgi:hypothetical protein
MVGLSDSVISRLEQGELAGMSLGSIRAVASRLGIRLDLVARWHGGALDRLVSSKHASLGEKVATWIVRSPGWAVHAEVSFGIYGERGVIDLLAWHEAAGALVVIELKTAIVDVDELLGTLDRKRRLASRIAAERGWKARSVSAWLIVGDSRSNRDRVGAHGTLLRAALPRDGRSFAPLFAQPEIGPVSGICFWPNSPQAGIGGSYSVQMRVVRRRNGNGAAGPRSAKAPQSGPHFTDGAHEPGTAANSHSAGIALEGAATRDRAGEIPR